LSPLLSILDAIPGASISDNLVTLRLHESVFPRMTRLVRSVSARLEPGFAAFSTMRRHGLASCRALRYRIRCPYALGRVLGSRGIAVILISHRGVPFLKSLAKAMGLI